jgi:hypothetical protein
MHHGGMMISQATLQGYFDGQKASTEAVIGFFDKTVAAFVPVLIMAIQAKTGSDKDRIEIEKLKLEQEKVRLETERLQIE